MNVVSIKNLSFPLNNRTFELFRQASECKMNLFIPPSVELKIEERKRLN